MSLAWDFHAQAAYWDCYGCWRLLRGPVLFGGCSEDLSPPVVLRISPYFSWLDLSPLVPVK